MQAATAEAEAQQAAFVAAALTNVDALPQPVLRVLTAMLEEAHGKCLGKMRARLATFHEDSDAIGQEIACLVAQAGPKHAALREEVTRDLNALYAELQGTQAQLEAAAMPVKRITPSAHKAELARLQQPVRLPHQTHVLVRGMGGIHPPTPSATHTQQTGSGGAQPAQRGTVTAILPSPRKEPAPGGFSDPRWKRGSPEHAAAKEAKRQAPLRHALAPVVAKEVMTGTLRHPTSRKGVVFAALGRLATRRLKRRLRETADISKLKALRADGTYGAINFSALKLSKRALRAWASGPLAAGTRVRVRVTLTPHGWSVTEIVSVEEQPGPSKLQRVMAELLGDGPAATAIAPAHSNPPPEQAAAPTSPPSTAASSGGRAAAAAAISGGGDAAATSGGGDAAAAATNDGGDATASSDGGDAAAAATGGGGDAAATNGGGEAAAAATSGGDDAAAADMQSEAGSVASGKSGGATKRIAAMSNEEMVAELERLGCQTETTGLLREELRTRLRAARRADSDAAGGPWGLSSNE